MKANRILLSILFMFIISGHIFMADSEMFHNDSVYDYRDRENGVSIKTVNGKFYAYIVLLFNENPHFVNLIQKGTISLKDIGVEGFQVKAYRSYLSTIQDTKLLEDGELILKIFFEPDQYNDSFLRQIENNLSKRNIILKFYREGYYKGARITFDYCIFGERVKIDIKHPLFELNDEMYYIKPFIYYDEFTTSNSTFYYDMIYISPDEVNNDSIIAKNVIGGKDVKSMFFVGSKITEEIKYCLHMAFKDNPSSVRNEIWKMFVIHELTHKILNNQFNNYDQITGEEISLSSTIYSNPYLGLSVLYSYLNYGKMNPHRMAAMNYISFVAEAAGNRDLINNTGNIKNIPADRLKKYSKNHFASAINKLKPNR
ncbi:MAG: hypothetical protein FWH53_02580 [Leptospirales bacterium]|nr:hypothetical protein [Leptospirales bacterium]